MKDVWVRGYHLRAVVCATEEFLSFHAIYKVTTEISIIPSILNHHHECKETQLRQSVLLSKGLSEPHSQE